MGKKCNYSKGGSIWGLLNEQAVILKNKRDKAKDDYEKKKISFHLKQTEKAIAKRQEAIFYFV